MNTVFWDPHNASNRISVKLVCLAKNQVLLIRKIGETNFNLIWGGVDYWESLEATIQREFVEETGIILEKENCPKLLNVELKHFPPGGQFDWVLNIFYLLEFDHQFTLQLEEGIYEEYKRCSREELKNLPVTEHTNKDIVFSAYNEE